MNLSTIEVTEEEATAKLAEYEEALKRERTVEDEAMAQAYRAAKRGLKVIRLPQVIGEGGYFNDGMPRIAIARADTTECYAAWGGDVLTFSEEPWPRNQGALVGAHHVRVNMRDIALPEQRIWKRGHAIVPSVPPRHRPKRYRLHRCHILWEVEAWNLIPPRDPALVRHIRGDLWAVLAVWDLTELERAVLSQRGV